MIPPADLRKALSGDDPPIGRPLSLSELGRRLAAHRQGMAAGQPYRKQTIAIYLETPGKQGPDFEEAFLSWRAAERMRQQGLHVRYENGMTVDEMIDEAGQVIQLGDNPVAYILVIGQLSPNAIIIPNSAPRVILSNITPRRCLICNREFLPRSWNHRRCGQDCPGENKP